MDRVGHAEDVLPEIWTATVRPLLRRAGHAEAEADRVGRHLLARWAEPHRRYHTTEHLAAVLTVVDRHAQLASDPAAVRLAAWFHDAVYDVGATDNEARSADLARDALTDLVDDVCVAEVARLVLLTAGHDPAPGDRNGALLADADLAILAAPEDAYDRYRERVRGEYAAIPDDAFRAGRAAVLRYLLSLPALYRLVPERVTWTTRAHANLHRELAILSG